MTSTPVGVLTITTVSTSILGMYMSSNVVFAVGCAADFRVDHMVDHAVDHAVDRTGGWSELRKLFWWVGLLVQFEWQALFQMLFCWSAKWFVNCVEWQGRMKAWCGICTMELLCSE